MYRLFKLGVSKFVNKFKVKNFFYKNKIVFLNKNKKFHFSILSIFFIELFKFNIKIRNLPTTKDFRLYTENYTKLHIKRP